MAMEWTEEQVAEAKQLAAEGWSGSQIGAKLGCSRSAVIGKLSRLGLDVQGQKLHFFANGKLQELERMYFSPKGYSREELAAHFGCSMIQVRSGIEKIRKAAGIKRGREHAPSRISQRLADRKIAPTFPPEISGTVPITAVKLLDLAPHHCRWPFGDPKDAAFCFCGADNLGHGSYCAAHHRKSRGSGGYQAQEVVA